MSTAHARLAALAPLFALTLGCTNGTLDQADSPVPALSLRIHLPPGLLPAETTEVAVTLAPIPYCPPSDVQYRPDEYGPPEYLETALAWTPLDRATDSMRLIAASSGDRSAFVCSHQPAPLVRLFTPTLFTSPYQLGGPPRPWISTDVIVAYTEVPARLTSFGPTEAPVILPAGYTLLRRRCGSPEQPWRLDAISPDELLEMVPLPEWPLPQPFPSALVMLEQRERALAASCGLTAPV
jgi:hypothetical protein